MQHAVAHGVEPLVPGFRSPNAAFSRNQRGIPDSRFETEPSPHRARSQYLQEEKEKEEDYDEGQDYEQDQD
jgi:hypothetical protein